VGVLVDSAPEIYPVNFAVDGATIVLRTERGNKLRGVDRSPSICFQIDGFDLDTRTGWSVLVKGKAILVREPHEVARLEQVALDLWALGEKTTWIQIIPTEVTGRRLHRGPVPREHEHCGACGFDGAGYGQASLLAALRALGPAWRTLIGSSGELLRARPGPEIWSAIEYAAHSRDVTALHAFGVEQALTNEEPTFPAIDGEELIHASSASYGDADPDQVVNALEAEATRMAQLADDAGSQAWTRGLTIGESRMDVRGLLEHALHDSMHHLDDVERGMSTMKRGGRRWID
jgi:hypothetical protein